MVAIAVVEGRSVSGFLCLEVRNFLGSTLPIRDFLVGLGVLIELDRGPGTPASRLTRHLQRASTSHHEGTKDDVDRTF